VAVKKKEIHIQIIDPDDINRRNMRHLLEREGYRTWSGIRGSDALKELRQRFFHIMLCNLQTADLDGIELMRRAKGLRPDIEVIFVTERATVDTAVQAMMAGAFSYLPRPFSITYFFDLIDKALEKTTRRWEISRRLQELRRRKGIQFVGRSANIVELKSEIAEIAQLDCNVLITGETGTGKELVASTIHALSQRAKQRFLPINCSALTPDLMLNELFGHEKEAFTGASKFRTGLFESANGGIILLDEIGEMPMIMQAKLLRVLQEKKIIRVGGTRQIDVDIRFLAATNRDLHKEVKNKNFRQDLFYRINVVSIEIPPLRRRRDDIPLLIEHFLAKYLLPEHRIKCVSPEALEILMHYDYPGNVRELENIIERSLAMCHGREIQPRHLPPELSGSRAMLIPPVRDDLVAVCTLREHEQRYILSVLSRVNGNKTRAAKILGIDRVSLWRKLKKYEQQGVDLDDGANRN